MLFAIAYIGLWSREVVVRMGSGVVHGVRYLAMSNYIGLAIKVQQD